MLYYLLYPFIWLKRKGRRLVLQPLKGYLFFLLMFAISLVKLAFISIWNIASVVRLHKKTMYLCMDMNGKRHLYDYVKYFIFESRDSEKTRQLKMQMALPMTHARRNEVLEEFRISQREDAKYY